MKKIIYQPVTKFINKANILQLIGFILFCSLIWVRFIRERLPKDIPFDLSLGGLLILLLICSLYIYNILKIIKHSSLSSNNYLLHYFEPLLKVFAKPLLQLNQLLLAQNTIRQLLKLFLISFYILFKPHIKYNDNNFIYVFIIIIPKIMFTICFVVDCFYFKQIFLTYNCIIIISFPLFLQYLLNIYEKLQDYDSQILDKYFIIEIISEDIQYKDTDYNSEGFMKPDVLQYYEEPSLMKYYCFYEKYEHVLPYLNTKQFKYLLTADFIEYQASAIYLNHLLYEYKILFHDEREDTITAKKMPRHPTLTKKDCENLLQSYIGICLLKDYLKAAKSYYNTKYVSDFNQNLIIFLNIIALICWLFILIISVSHLNDLDILIKFKDNVEPFSQNILDYNETNAAN